MTAKRKSLATAVVCLSAVIVLAGCSQDGDIKAKGASGERRGPAAVTSGDGESLEGLDAGQIADKAVAATRAAKSLAMAGRIEKDGEPVSIDLALDSGEKCSGLLGVKGGRAELRQVSEVMYLKGDEQFWSASLRERSSESPGVDSDAVVELLQSRWVKMPTGTVKDLDRVCDLKAMFAQMDVDEADRKQMTKGPDSQVEGVPTVTLVKQEQDRTTTVHVAKEGKPYVLKIVKAGGDETGTIVLSHYDEPVEVEAPPAEEVVDLGNLTGGAGLGFEAGATQSGEGSGTDGQPDMGADVGIGAGTEAGENQEADAGTGSDQGSGSAQDTDADTETGDGSGSDAEGLVTDEGVDSESGSDTGSGAGTAADGANAS
ncbi:hypothetical protein GLX30_12865 [Streptomyces sp. Tu 2975]|uniref:hypothetical protein n=1 Tax=Streptomyces sp. Tu 2975 TaxID=2676871 RepID=UPI00135B8F2C|nr:hypothetical protein [Streptomyces sp. Tu 2975]QIP84775.1 hypothetical protein GLX30_12865 [Streptomyces sp. Tu 2975]